MEELRYLTVFRILAEKIEALEITNEAYYNRISELEKELTKIKCEREVMKGE